MISAVIDGLLYAHPGTCLSDEVGGIFFVTQWSVAGLYRNRRRNGWEAQMPPTSSFEQAPGST